VTTILNEQFAGQIGGERAPPGENPDCTREIGTGVNCEKLDHFTQINNVDLTSR